MPDIITKIIVDDSDIEKAERTQAAFLAQSLTALRRYTRLITLTSQAVGFVVDEGLRASIEAGILIAEYAVTAIAVQSFTPFGALVSVSKIGQITALLFQISALRRGRTQVAARLGSAEEALNILAF